MRDLKFLYFLAIISIVFCISLTSGCATTKTTTVTTYDDQNRPIETTIEEPTETTSFFESGNLNKFYEHEGNRVDKFNALASEKISFIKEQGLARQKDLTTPTERALSNIVDTLLVAQIPTTPPPDGIVQPKTMVDFFDKNFVSIASLGLQAYGLGLFGDVDRPQNDSSVTINNSGLGDVFYHSDNNKNPTYSVAGKSSGYWDLGLSKGGDTTTSNDSSQKTLW